MILEISVLSIPLVLFFILCMFFDDTNGGDTPFLFFVFFVSAIFCWAPLVISLNLEPQHHEEPIYSLERGETIEGSFVLGSGTISGDVVYYAYIKEKGGLTLQEIDSDVIIYEGNYTPKYVVGQNFSEEPGFFNFLSYERNVYKKLYVPENTIKKQFDVN